MKRFLGGEKEGRKEGIVVEGKWRKLGTISGDRRNSVDVGNTAWVVGEHEVAHNCGAGYDKW